MKVTKKRPQSAKIGREKRKVARNDLTPGPGHYQMENIPRPASPKHSFTRDRKGKMFRPTTPGPGEYYINPIIGTVPQYVMR